MVPFASAAWTRTESVDSCMYAGSRTCDHMHCAFSSPIHDV